VILQAGALQVTAADEPTRRAADGLRSAGCQALEELRGVIGMLRQPADLTDLPDRPPPPPAAAFDADDYVLRALSAGAAGFVVESTPPHDFADLVRVAASGHTVLSPIATRRLVAGSSTERDARERNQQLMATLSERERDVLTCLGEGLSNAQIGERLFLPEATVKGCVSRVLSKLQCANRTQARLLAHASGLAAGQ
jgi:DNA-binding NarL/FixJ family response regulator